MFDLKIVIVMRICVQFILVPVRSLVNKVVDLACL